MKKTNKLTDDKQRELIEAFANDTSVAKGGNITINYNCNHISFTPNNGTEGFTHEDANYLSDLIKGAESFLYWVRRNNIKIEG